MSCRGVKEGNYDCPNLSNVHIVRIAIYMCVIETIAIFADILDSVIVAFYSVDDRRDVSGMRIRIKQM